MSNIDFRKKAIAAGVVIGMLSGAGVMTASANTNPFTGGASNNPPGALSLTGGSGSSASSSEKTTVESVKAASAGTNSTPAKETPSANTTRTVSSPNHVQAADGTAKKSDNVAEAAQGCPVAEHAQEVQMARLDAIDATPSRITAMENIEQSEAGKGCLSSSKEIIDLTMTLPTISGSWGDIGKVVRMRVDEEINKIKDGVINQACQIADQALLDANKNVQEFYKVWNDKMNVINNAPAFVGKYLGDKVVYGSDKVGAHLSEKLQGMQSKVDATNAEFAAKNKAYRDSVNEKVYDTFGFNIEDADNVLTGIYKENIELEIRDVESRIPPKPDYTAQTFDGKYYKCQGTNCTAINSAEYRDLVEKHRAHENAVAAAKPQLENLRKQLSTVGQKTASNTQTTPAQQPAAAPTVGNTGGVSGTLQQAVNNANTQAANTQQVPQTAPATAEKPTLTESYNKTQQDAVKATNETAKEKLESNWSVSNLINRFTGSGSSGGTSGSNPFNN